MSEKSSERVDDPLDKMKKLNEKWKNRFTADNLRIVERYCHKELDIALHCRRMGAAGTRPTSALSSNPQTLPEVEREDLVGIEAGKRNPEGSANPVVVSLRDSGRPVSAPGSHSANDQKSMFVEIVKLMERPEAVVPALVGIQSIDQAYGGGLQSRYFFSGLLGLVSGETLANRERGIAGWLGAISLDKLSNQMIDGGSEVVNGIADDTTQGVGNGLDDLHPEDLVAGIRLALCDDSVWVLRVKGIDPAFEITDVVVGPCDFRLYAG